ncbi:CLUMA_CG003848, isoform A [Clunio marinus]|uniref:CLUMA_CG003848, isoform A n=1 Tax=Clunio marinus TaxID=568069 RepID=A0A1J1HQ75_9DIPT|nr:CLUMA_CG003848, isoform A [Clunio marinus]
MEMTSLPSKCRLRRHENLPQFGIIDEISSSELLVLTFEATELQPEMFSKCFFPVFCLHSYKGKGKLVL